MNSDPASHTTGLIVGPDERRRREAIKVARAAVDQIDFASAETDSRTLTPETYDLVLVDADPDWAREHGELFEKFDRHRRTHRLLIHTSELERPEYALLFGELRVGNLLACDAGIRRSELFATLRKMIGDDIFGLEKYLAWGAQTHSEEIESSRQIEPAVERAHTFVTEIGMPERLAEQFSRAVGEFVTNAIYDAPVGSDGTSRFSDVSHSEAVDLDAGETVRLELARDGTKVGVSVVDPFGSLSVDSLFQYLARCFRNGSSQIRWDTPGAGLGLYQSFKGLSHFVINLDADRKTEVIGLLNIRESYSDFAAEGNCLNLFVQ